MRLVATSSALLLLMSSMTSASMARHGRNRKEKKKESHRHRKQLRQHPQQISKQLRQTTKLVDVNDPKSFVSVTGFEGPPSGFEAAFTGDACKASFLGPWNDQELFIANISSTSPKGCLQQQRLQSNNVTLDVNSTGMTLSFCGPGEGTWRSVCEGLRTFTSRQNKP